MHTLRDIMDGSERVIELIKNSSVENTNFSFGLTSVNIREVRFKVRRSYI